MKDSGVEWIGKIPDNVGILKAKYLFSFQKGKLPTSVNNDCRGLPCIGASEMNGAEPSNYTEDNLPTCHKSDILLLWDGANAGLVSTGHEGIVASTVCRVRLTSNLCFPRFAYYTLKNAERYYRDKVGGTTIPHMNPSYINDTLIVNFDYQEQQRISAFLDKKCSAIDDVLAKTQESIEEYKKLKQAVITEAVTKGVRGKRPMKDSGIDCIGYIPDTWQCCKIRYLHKGLTDGTHGTYNRTDNGRLLLSSKNVRENALEIGDNESYISEEDYQSIVASGFPQRNDVLMCCIGASIGRCIIYDYDEPMAFQRSVIFIRSNAHYTPRMLRYSLLSNATAVQEQFLINQSAQAGLYQGSVAEIYVTVPSLDEQQEIADYLDKKCVAIDTLISKKQQFIEELTAYKKSLIYEYVTGKKEVPA